MTALYLKGKRQPGPNRFGYDPCHPRLVPARRVNFDRPPPEPIRLAVEHLTDIETWHNRPREHQALRRRRRRAPDGRMVTYTPGLAADDPADKRLRKPRGDHRAAAHALLAFVVEHADVRTGLSGKWLTYVDDRGQKKRSFERPWSRHELAAGAGVDVGQLDELIDHLKAAVYIDRRQRRRKERDGDGNTTRYVGLLASLLLTDAFWAACGPQVWRARQRFLHRQDPPKPKPPKPSTDRAWLPPSSQIEADVARCRATWDDPPP